MTCRALGFAVLLFGGLAASALLADPPAPRSSKEALQAFNDLIGTWRGTGTPSGSRDEQRDKFWIETITWEWQFKDKDAWLKVEFAKSKQFTAGELRYLPDKNEYALTVRTPEKQTLTFAGPLKERVLTLDRVVDGETQRLVLTLLHSNRYLYRYEVRPPAKVLFAKKYQVGATKEGVAFATGDGKPECVVSGGLGTMQVSYQGKTYYVCCSGCRAEFNENPRKYVKEYEEKKAKQK
jgi:ribosomal protein L24E